jgi:hypothetical protein
VRVNPYLIDAIIGFSVAYKALDNIGAWRRWLGGQPSIKVSTALFGLMHGLGLATKLRDFELTDPGLVANLVSFNVGVEVGQILALSAILVAMGYWRRSDSFVRHAHAANIALLMSGILLVAYQVSEYLGGHA